MAGLLLKNLNKIYPGAHQVIRDLNLEIPEKEFLVLTGPEGCGKTTLLRMIAGLEEVTSGQVWLDGAEVTELDPRDRKLAMLFRNSVLYPELSVSDNLAFSLRLDKLPQGLIEQRVAEIAELFSLTGVLRKFPRELTEEEYFSALLGRALARNPRLLLIDGTFLELSLEQRERLRRQLREVYEKMDFTVIYAAENDDGIVRECTRLILMKEGAIIQDGTPEKLHERPADVFTARLLNQPPMNMLCGTLKEEADGLFLLIHDGRLPIPEEAGAALLEKGYLGKMLLLGILPEEVSLTEESEKEGFSAAVQGIETFGNRPFLHFHVGEMDGLAAYPAMNPAEAGETVWLTAAMERALFFDLETEKIII